MSDASKGGESVTRVRIERLRLRVPAGDAGSAKALARAVATELALRARELEGLAGRETVNARVAAVHPLSPARLADAIVGGIAHPQAGKPGGR